MTRRLRRHGSQAWDRIDGPAVCSPCLHGLSFDAAHLGAVYFLAGLLPSGKARAAQSDYSTLVAVVSAAEID
jgi:hypothetical protein